MSSFKPTIWFLDKIEDTSSLLNFEWTICLRITNSCIVFLHWQIRHFDFVSQMSLDHRMSMKSGPRASSLACTKKYDDTIFRLAHFQVAYCQTWRPFVGTHGLLALRWQIVSMRAPFNVVNANRADMRRSSSRSPLAVGRIRWSYCITWHGPPMCEMQHGKYLLLLFHLIVSWRN